MYRRRRPDSRYRPRSGSPVTATACVPDSASELERTDLERLYGRFPPTDSTAAGGRIVESATLGTLLFVILPFPPDSFYRVTAIHEELIEHVVTGTVG
ncbi:hypothetical protein AArcMg_0422 [Natrarchaeobaculum sulfurireducens]|uniref:Uncharacterized protein n=1 Tax=Natrarchaeobaculum sulfurireducens TaxID=2044521 RepID=A0A346PLQ0_9EURY|nr:hypothetical protein AArcMg_0422 [Natrarchaeobaculum sulfurireducens]